MSLYDGEFYRGQRDASFIGAERVLPEVFALIPCRSILDVGCGVGPWVAAAMKLGVADALGVDGSYVDRRLLLIPPECFQAVDLTQPVDLGRRFDLVMCMEVAEHLPRAEPIVDTLVKHADAILFSAAVPGQGGTNHINEQWPDYWQKEFAKRGFRQLDVLRSRIWDIDDIPVCYRQNSFLYIAEEKLALYPRLMQAIDGPRPVAWVHPAVLLEAANRPLTLRRILRELPGALKETVRLRSARLLGRK